MVLSTIDSLAQENRSLKKEVNDSKISIEERLEAGTLEQENERLQRFIDSIPQDMLNEIQSQQRKLPQKGRHGRD